MKRKSVGNREKMGEVTSFKTVTSSENHMWKSSRQLIKAKNYTAIGRRSS